MSAAFALRLGQRAAEAQMVDTCVVSRRSDDEQLDPETNLYLPAWTVIYTGPCELKFEDASTRTRDQQSQLPAEVHSILKVPYDGTDGIAVDDEVDFASQNATVRISGTFAQTFATARRFPVEALA